MVDIASSTPLTKKERMVLVNAILVVLSCFLPLDLYLPSLPHIVKALHTTTDQIQLSITLFLLGSASTQLFFGPLSDRFGRKPCMIIGLCTATLGSLLIVFCHSAFLFMLARLIEGMGAGIGVLLARTMASDLFTGQRLATVGSYVTMVFSLSPIFAPALGGLLQTYFGWRSNFIFMATFECIVLLIFILFCPETNQNKQIKSTQIKVIISNYKTLISSRVFMGFLLGSGIAMSTNTVYAVVAPFLFQDHFQLSAQNFGFLAIILGFGNFLGKLSNSIILKKFSIKGAISLSYTLIIVAGLVLFGCIGLDIVTVLTVMIGMFIATFSIGFMTSNAMAGALSPFRHMGGTTAALYGSLQMFIGFISSSLIAALPWHNTFVTASSYIGLGCIGLLGFYLLILAKKD